VSGGRVAGPTAAPLRVGVTIPYGNAGAIAGIDATNTPPDQAEAEFRALAGQVNARGGFGGHKIQLFFARMDKTDESEATYTRLQNANCVELTEDDKVDFVINAAYTTYANDCYARHHVPLLNASGASEADWRRLSPWLMPALGISMSRTARLMPFEWQRSGFLTSKMGIIAFDRNPEKPLVPRFLRPGIEARGGKVLAEAYIQTSYDQIAAQTASAVLKFKQLGVDRVVFLAPGGGEWLIFSRQAESQDFHPKYGISTLDFPDLIGNAVSGAQKQGATGPGTLAAVDVAASERPPTKQKGKDCWKYLNAKTGSNYSTEDTPGLNALSRCELMSVAEAGWKAMAGVSLDRTKVRNAFFAIGDAYDSILFSQLSFSPDKVDSLSVYKTLVYDSARQLFTYSGPYRRITV
jgi:hypothetical protein